MRRSTGAADEARRTGAPAAPVRRVGAASPLEALLGAEAQLGDLWLSIARGLVAEGRMSAAEAALRRHARERPHGSKAALARARIAAEAGRFAAASAFLSGAPVGDEEPDRLRLDGKIRLAAGDLEGACDRFRASLRIDRGQAKTWLDLTKALPGRLEPDELADLEDLARRRRGADGADAARLLYALYRARRAEGADEEAVAALCAGAAAARRVYAYDAPAERAAVREVLRRAARTGPFGPRDPQGRGSDVILVTGLPRSGTTLVEQILCACEGVTDGAEVEAFPRLLAARTEEAAPAEALDPDVLAGDYLRLLAERLGASGRRIDKTLEAGRYLDLAMRALPGAPVVWVRRDRRDCAWSIFETFFDSGLAWSWSLSDVAARLREDEALFSAWRERLGERLHVVRLEELRSAPLQVVPKLQAACGVDSRDHGPEPHRVRRYVVTESAAQVRRPLGPGTPPRPSAAEPLLDAFEEAYAADAL